MDSEFSSVPDLCVCVCVCVCVCLCRRTDPVQGSRGGRCRSRYPDLSGQSLWGQQRLAASTTAEGQNGKILCFFILF